jgi:hypothetical protein
MGLKAFGDRIAAAFRFRHQSGNRLAPTSDPTMRLARALPSPRVHWAGTDEFVTGQSLDERALDDAYWILRCAIGIALEERLEYYRAHLLRRGTESGEIARRLDAIRPFLTVMVDGDEDGGVRLSGVRMVTQREGSPGFGILFPNGVLQMLSSAPALTTEQADAQLGGGAQLVWRDAQGALCAVSVPIQEYDDDLEAEEETL